MGEMAGVFARGFLKAGHPVFPVRREDDINQVAHDLENLALVLIAVAENDLSPLLQQIPEQWREKLVLLQNELLPKDWMVHNLINPTVISVWFEKKPGQDFKVLVPSPIFGPKAELVQHALATLEIPVEVVADAHRLLFELVRKNLYILTTNICGLETGGNVKQLWDEYSILMNRVFDNVLDIQQYLTGETFDRDHLLAAVLTAFDGDPEHKCMGRSAPQRLQRALGIADEAGLEVDELKRISSQL
jgi:hypothetical protein